MGLYQFLMWNFPERIAEEESVRRIFHFVPRRKRSPRRRNKKDPRDFSKVPKKKRIVYEYTTTPKWIRRLKKDRKIEHDPILLAEKPLDLDDVDPSQNRLSVPSHILQRNDFLTCEERRILGDESINNEGRMGVAAFLVDQRTKQWNVVLKKWVRMTDSGKVLGSYLLCGEWSDVVEANGLRDDDNISLWAFRQDGILFFALDFAGDSVGFLE